MQCQHPVTTIWVVCTHHCDDLRDPPGNGFFVTSARTSVVTELGGRGPRGTSTSSLLSVAFLSLIVVLSGLLLSPSGFGRHLRRNAVLSLLSRRALASRLGLLLLLQTQYREKVHHDILY